MSNLLPVGTKIKITDMDNDDMFADIAGWIGTIESHEDEMGMIYYKVNFGLQPEDIGIIDGPEYFLIHPMVDKFEVVE